MNNSPLTDLRDHGIAVHNGCWLSFKLWRDAESGRDYAYAGILSTSSLIVQVDIASGRSRTFPMPAPCDTPWGLDCTLDGDVLVAGLSGHLGRLNPRTGKFVVIDTGGNWLWNVDRGADGKHYLSSSPKCHLLRYDATTEKCEDLGPLDAVQTYLRSVMGGDDGYVYCSIGCTAAQIVAYHIASGRIIPLLPKHEVQPGFQQMVRGSDGKIYVETLGGNLYRLAHAAAFPVGNPKQMRPLLKNGFDFLPDGRKVTRLDPDAIRVGEGPRARIISLNYRTAGANIFHLAEGPHKTVYGSSIMPLYLFRYSPATRKLENLGRGGPDGGESYSFGQCDNKLYYANYHLGNLMCYDPAKPLHKDPPGALKWKDNPRLITPLGEGHCRPRAMCVDSKKRVWVGSFPEYGRANGGLGCYDTVRKKYRNNPVVIPNQSIVGLAADPSGDIIYGATSIGRGSGTEPVTKEAHLFAWDARRQKLLWKQVPIPGIDGAQNLLYRNGKLYGTTGKPFSFFRFDLKSRKMDYVVHSEISGVREQSIVFGADGNIYGITWMVLFRWRPESGKIEELYRCLGEEAKPFGGSLFHRGAILIDGRYYFSCGTKVMSLPVALEKAKN